MIKTRLIFSFILISTSLYSQLKIDSLLSSTNYGAKENNAKIYLQIANEYIKSQPDSCIYYAEESLQIAKSQGYHAEVARSYSVIAGAYQNKSELDSSISYFFKSIEVSENHQIKETLASAYNGLGISYYYLEDIDQAEKYFLKAMDFKLALKDYTYYSVISMNLASIYIHYKRYRDAIKLLEKAEQVLLESDQKKYLSNLYNSMGASYQYISSNIDSVKLYYQKSINFAKEYDVPDNIISGYHNIGQLYSDEGKYDQAIYFLKQAESECEKLNQDEYKLKTYRTIAETYEHSNDYQNALLYRKKEIELRKSIFDSRKQKAINELQIKFETAKKEKLIAQNEKEIQTQKQEIQKAQLIAEKSKNQFYIFLFFSITLFLVVLFSVIVVFQRKKNARAIEQEKLKVFENIVHDIRTPVSLIKGPLQVLKDGKANKKNQAENFTLIERNADKLIALVNELLDTSKVEKGGYRIRKKTGNIDGFIQSTLQSFSSEAKEKQITITYHSNDMTDNFSFCASVIEKVISNIVGNALKYCPANSHVTISSEIKDQLLYLVISDDGEGIPKKEHKNIFKRFYRRKEHKKGTGTGIGLALVKDLVQLAGGIIDMESELGKGTTFKVSLPVEPVASPDVEIPDNETSKLQLLLCDDDSDIISFVKSVLQNDFFIHTASDGNEGLSKFNEVSPDIVLSDVMMPQKGGLELLQEIKSNKLTNHTPVVLFSAKSSLESRLNGLKYGADAYIPKPFDPNEMRLVLQNLSQTIQRNKEAFQENIKSNKTFDDRLKSSNEYVNKAVGFVVQNIDDFTYSVNELASDLCVSRSQLHRKLTTYTGFSTTNFIKMIRLEKSKDMLESHQGNITEIADACGFSSRSYFSTQFTKYFGITPSKFVSKL